MWSRRASHQTTGPSGQRVGMELLGCGIGSRVS
eukprot:CAMPEP_0185846108 /NCGR_PEP_ID=MMETSP1354-20130828/1858_1 /TAXON_ID=708628 /ORGANISM="Erythrolobus madagascarensis, Strain CCMP3276" /LENGTH=32 /DNA_ID= /DNA_START= /DNA_END= /DNA_ORIENTATION=